MFWEKDCSLLYVCTACRHLDSVRNKCGRVATNLALIMLRGMVLPVSKQEFFKRSPTEERISKYKKNLTTLKWSKSLHYCCCSWLLFPIQLFAVRYHFMVDKPLPAVGYQYLYINYQS